MTTADYLEQLVRDVETVRTNLNILSVPTLPTDTLTTLAPKILDVATDLGTVFYVRLFDLYENIQGKHNLYETDYTESEISKIDNLLNILGGD